MAFLITASTFFAWIFWTAVLSFIGGVWATHWWNNRKPPRQGAPA